MTADALRGAAERLCQEYVEGLGEGQLDHPVEFAGGESDGRSRSFFCCLSIALQQAETRIVRRGPHWLFKCVLPCRVCLLLSNYATWLDC